MSISHASISLIKTVFHFFCKCTINSTLSHKRKYQMVRYESCFFDGSDINFVSFQWIRKDVAVNSALILYFNLLQSFYYVSESILHNISISRDVYFCIVKQCYIFSIQIAVFHFYIRKLLLHSFRPQKTHLKSLKSLKTFKSYLLLLSLCAVKGVKINSLFNRYNVNNFLV